MQPINLLALIPVMRLGRASVITKTVAMMSDLMMAATTAGVHVVEAAAEVVSVVVVV